MWIIVVDVGNIISITMCGFILVHVSNNIRSVIYLLPFKFNNR